MREEQKRILKLVEQGKLSAEEAILLIEKLSTHDEKSNFDKVQELKTELSTDVQYEQQNKHSNHEKLTSAKNKFMDFVDSAISKIKDLDLDFNFGNAIEVNHIFQQSEVSINQIDVDVANGSVSIHPWDENEVRVECNAKVYKIDNQDKARQAFLREVLFLVENGKLRFGVHKKQMKVQVKIFVPKSDYEHVKIRTFNGPISGENLVANELRGKTANGSITFNHCTTASMEVETANGHINAEKTTSKDFEAETINGTIKVSGTFEKVDLQSFNGNIKCALETNICHTAYVKTTTGAIDLSIQSDYEVDGELKSNLGSFKAELSNMSVIEEKNEVVQKSLRFKANEGSGNKLTLFAETKAGAIKIKPV